MSHYTAAVAEFKARWELEDSALLDAMISELREEVGRRIQGSVGRELKKIQGRAGRGGRAPRPPPAGTLSRESTMTERRRQMLKVSGGWLVSQPDHYDINDHNNYYNNHNNNNKECLNVSMYI